jgi:lipopolysaccharide export LptBFGC system permease protein LptF
VVFSATPTTGRWDNICFFRNEDAYVININDKKRIETAISKTGFLLEKYVSDILENTGWTVINNRYYIDSITNTPRELDILAYRAKSYQDIYHYFTLLISCKKSEGRDWVFLTKPIQNRNIDLIPMTIHTNSEIIETTDYREQLRDLIKDNFEANTIFPIFSALKTMFLHSRRLIMINQKMMQPFLVLLTVC